jgi:opacity protein-like surface antigen
MANGFIDLHNDTPVTPYVGGGIGFAALHLTDTHDNFTGDRLYREDDATVFAYQAGAGLDIALNRRVSLDLGYRYFGTSKAEFDSNNQLNSSTAEMRYESHNMAVGVKFKF